MTENSTKPANDHPAAAAPPGHDTHVAPPLYHQIYVVLRDEILNGTRPRGSYLPGEFEIAREFSVSRITAKRTLNELAAAGLVVRERGRGTRVVYNSAPPVYSPIEGMIENLIAMGLKTDVELLEFDYVTPIGEVADALSCQAEDLVQRAVRVRSLDTAPISHLTTAVPADIGRSYERHELAEKPLLALLERHGVVIGAAKQTITATLATAIVAPRLEVTVGAPLLCVTRIVYDQEHRPVEYVEGLHRPDRYRYQTMLQRVDDIDRKLWSPALEINIKPAT